MSNFSRGSAACASLFIVIFSFTVAVSSGADAMKLEIWPLAPVQTKSVGSKVLLTCRIAAGGSIQEVRDLHWLDPQNRTIDNNNPLLKDRITTMHMPNDKSLLLIFQDLRADDGGQYTCVGSYSNAEQLAASVLIETIQPIMWVDAPTVQNPIKGKEGKIKCRVNANPSPNVDLLRNGVAIQSGDRYVIETDGLTIKNVQESDDGSYICRAVVIQTGEFAERVIKVEVQSPPVIDDSMISEIKVTEGESASIACKAYAKPPPSYSWIKESTKQNLGVGSERFMVNEHTGILTINHALKDDDGEFRCVANNPAGSVEKAVKVTVIVKPKIFNLRNISAAVNHEAKLECQATGNPLPNISFRKLSSETSFVLGVQSTDSRISVEIAKNQVKGEVTATLIISQLRREDDGLYACTAENKGGKEIKNGHLTVEFPPSFKNSPIKEAWSWNRMPVNLTCLAESIPNATITWELNNRLIEGEYTFRKYGNGPESTLTVTPSDARFYGHYKCVARNNHGEAKHIIELKEARAPSAVQQARPTIVTANTINFDIVGPNDHGGQKIKAYVVQYKTDRDRDWHMARNHTWTVDAAHILENLRPNTKYIFRFAAVNDVGEGPYSALVEQFMPATSAPQVPAIVTQPGPDGYIYSNYSSLAQIRWRIPHNNGAPIIKYTLTYCVVEDTGLERRVVRSTCRQSEVNSERTTVYDFRDLRPDTTYKFEVRAQNQIGFSQPAEAYVRTAKGSIDSQMHTVPSDRLSSAVLVLVVVAALFGILVIVDVSCFFFNETGLLSLACSSLCGKKKKHAKDDDPKLGSEAKELLNGHRDSKVRIDSNMDDSMKKNMQVNYDMKKSISKTSFVGKDSAV
nr:PREDICTED: fasciclin-2-like [Bemisia tabaci]